MHLPTRGIVGSGGWRVPIQGLGWTGAVAAAGPVLQPAAMLPLRVEAGLCCGWYEPVQHPRAPSPRYVGLPRQRCGWRDAARVGTELRKSRDGFPGWRRSAGLPHPCKSHAVLPAMQPSLVGCGSSSMQAVWGRDCLLLCMSSAWHPGPGLGLAGVAAVHKVLVHCFYSSSSPGAASVAPCPYIQAPAPLPHSPPRLRESMCMSVP